MIAIKPNGEFYKTPKGRNNLRKVVLDFASQTRVDMMPITFDTGEYINITVCYNSLRDAALETKAGTIVELRDGRIWLRKLRRARNLQPL